MEILQVLARDGLDRLRPAILGTAKGMPRKQYFAKNQVRHIGRILRADGQPGQQLGTQAFDLVGWKGGELDRFREDVQQQGQILGEGAPAETGRVRARVVPESRADRFERVVNLLHVTLDCTAHQRRADKIRQPQFVVRFKESFPW